MKLTFEQIEEFVAYKASYLPNGLSTSTTFRPAIEQHIGALTRLAQPKVGAKRKAFLKSELDGEEFRERVLLDDGARVVVGGIRFRNLDRTFPFVEVNASFDLFEPDLISYVGWLARQQFGRFEPKGILAVGPPNVALSTGVQRWSHIVCGPTISSSNALLPAAITCSFPAGTEFYDEYRTAYAEWRSSSPGLSSFVRAEPREDLQASASQQLLASFADPAGWCGIVAAREEALYGMPALYIYDIFLVGRWRGKGAAKAVDTAFVSSVASRYSLIWEHIHSANLPSLRVALSQGRPVLETEYFLPYGEET